MKESLIKFLEMLLLYLKGKPVLNTAKSEALEFIDMAASKAIEDVNSLFSSSSVFGKVEKYYSLATELKSNPLVSANKNVYDTLSFVASAADMVMKLEDRAVARIKVEQERLKSAVNEATSEEAIDEILRLSASMIAATPAYLSTVFIKAGAK